MIIVLSPAKSLEWEKDHISLKATSPYFLEQASYLVQKLQKLSARQLKKLMNISDDLAEVNVERYQNFFNDLEPKRMAAYAFDGDVYKGLDAFSLDENDMEFAQKHLRILSGLYGVLRPCDHIKPYRLEMGCSFKVTPAKNNLYKYWGSSVALSIKKELELHEHPILINAASNEYFKVLAKDVKKLGVEVLDVDFKEEKDGEFKTIGFFAKKARGLFARYLIDKQVEKPEELKEFNQEGYSLNLELSTENKWIYTRKQ